MDLKRRLVRLRYVYGWRMRYWWLDTRSGLITRIALAIMLLIGVIAETVYEILAARVIVHAGQPHQAVIGIIVYLIVALVIAVIAIAMMPKPKPAQPQQANTPTTTDGQQVIDLFGTGWTDDGFILAWKQMGTEPIKASGGK